MNREDVPPATAAEALLEWFNDFPISEKIKSLKELHDGLLLRKLLLTLDPEYFGSHLGDEGSTQREFWLPKFQRLKEIYKAVTSYLRNECERADLHLQPIDLKAIAEKSSEEEIIKLFQAIILATLFSPASDDYYPKLLQLSVPTQKFLALLLDPVQSPTSSPSANQSSENASHKQSLRIKLDPELQYEERLSTTMTENEALKKDKNSLQEEVTQLSNRLGRLQKNNEILQMRLSEVETKASKSVDDEGYARMSRLETTLRESEDLIAYQESKLAELQKDSVMFKKTIEGLEIQVAGVQKIQDELDEIKVERDNLAKKANTLEKFKQKLKDTQNLENENRRLQKTIDEMKGGWKSSDDAQKELAGAKLTMSQYRKTVEKVEQDNHDLLTHKRRLELENAALHDRLEQQLQNSDIIADLQDKIRELEAGVVPSRTQTTEEEEDSLDSELTFSDQTKRDLKLEIMRLKTEIQKLKDDGGAAARAVMLENLLEDARIAKEKYQSLYIEDHQARLALESQISAIEEGESGAGSAVFLKLRKNLLETEEKLSETRMKLSETAAKLSIAEKELTLAKSDLSMVGKDELEALEALKQRNSAEVVELRDEVNDRDLQLKNVQMDLEETRLLLNTALLDKDVYQKKLEEQKDANRKLIDDNNEYKSTFDLLQAAKEGREEGFKEALDTKILRLQKQLEIAKEKQAKRQEHIKKQNAVVKELQERLQRAEEEDKESATKAKEELLVEQKKAKEQELLNLNRENSLMTTAWYDLTTRLQMNSVVLLRRNDVPTSFLPKQRHLLNASSVR